MAVCLGAIELSSQTEGKGDAEGDRNHACLEWYLAPDPAIALDVVT